MEWKEHVAWLAPMFATTAAFIVAYYGMKLARQGRVRRLAIALFVLHSQLLRSLACSVR